MSLVLLDGELVAAEEARLSVFDRSVLYGESLFETLKVVDQAPCLWKPHLARLTASAAALGLPFEPGAVEKGVRLLLDAEGPAHGVLRMQLTGGTQPGGRGLVAPSSRQPHFVASVSAAAPLDPAFYSEGVGVIVAPDLARSLPRHKSGSYLAGVEGKRRAERAGAFECLLARGEELLEGAFSNLLLVTEAGLRRVPSGSALEGVTMVTVLEEAVGLGHAAEEAPVSVPDARVGGLLLTGSLVGVLPVSTLDGAPLPSTTQTARSLMDRLRQREEASVREWRESSGGTAPITRERQD